MQAKQTQDGGEPYHNGHSMPKKMKGVRKCCCSWGDACKDIQMAIQSLPSGSEFDLWKQPYAQISTAKTGKKWAFLNILHWHLGIKGDYPVKYRVAPHHWPIDFYDGD